MLLFLNTVRLYPEQLKLEQSLKKYHVLRDANQSVLNCVRFLYFRPLTHDITTPNTTRSIYCKTKKFFLGQKSSRIPIN